MANYTTNTITKIVSAGNNNVNADMYITPNPGFVVRATDFTAVDNPDIGTITIGSIVDTTSAYAIGNTVKIPITLTNYVMSPSDKKLKIDITGDAVLYSSLTQTVPISFTINNNLTTGVASGITMTSAAGANDMTVSSGTPGASDVVFSGDATFVEGAQEVGVGSIVLTAETGAVTGVSANFSNSDTTTINNSNLVGVSVGDLVTGNNVTEGTFVIGITNTGTSSLVKVSNNLNGTISLTFTQDQVFDENPLVDVVEVANEIIDGIPRQITVVPSDVTTNDEGYAKSITLNLFASTKAPIRKSDNLRLNLTGKSSSIVRTNKIKGIDFGSTTIHPGGETRTIKVYGDVGAKFNMALVDSASSPVNVFTALSNAVIPAGTSSSKGQGVYTQEVVIPAGVNGTAGSIHKPPYKLDISAGINTLKDDAINTATPDYTLNQYAYPKLTINSVNAANQPYVLPASKVIIGRPNTSASHLNQLKPVGDTINIEFVLVGNNSQTTFGSPLVSTVASTHITGHDAAVATISSSAINSITRGEIVDKFGVATEICTIKFTLRLGEFGTTDKTYTVKLNELITAATE